MIDGHLTARGVYAFHNQIFPHCNKRLASNYPKAR